jgi:hypothetical protein
VAKVLDDPRVKELEGQEVTDVSGVRYGGCTTLGVSA